MNTALPTAKVCRTCGTEKPTTEFYKHKVYRDGLTADCRMCCSLRNSARKRIDALFIASGAGDPDPSECRRVQRCPGYWISRTGELYRQLKSGRLRPIRAHVSRDGYLICPVSIAGVDVTAYCHQLTAEAFLSQRPTPQHQVNHINGIKADNRFENLEWVTRSENSIHAITNGLQTVMRGSAHPHAKISEGQVLEIRKLLADGVTGREVAKRFGLHPMSVSNIRLRKVWKHVE